MHRRDPHLHNPVVWVQHTGGSRHSCYRPRLAAATLHWQRCAWQRQPTLGGLACCFNALSLLSQYSQLGLQVCKSLPIVPHLCQSVRQAS